MVTQKVGQLLSVGGVFVNTQLSEENKQYVAIRTDTIVICHDILASIQSQEFSSFFLSIYAVLVHKPCKRN